MKRTVLGLSLWIALIGAKALADDAPAQKKDDAWHADAKTIAHVQEIVNGTAGSDGVFTVRDNGEIAHVQSGLVCPPKFPNVDFWHAEIFDSPLGKGMDVGCDYGRNGPDGHPVSKLTIFATKAPAPITLGQAFSQYRSAVMQVSPNAVSQGEALNIEEKSGGSKHLLPEVRSEEFCETRDGKVYTSDLVVAVSGGWMLEIRATFDGKPNEISLPEGATVDDVLAATGDRVMVAEAFVRLAPTIGKDATP